MGHDRDQFMQARKNVFALLDRTAPPDFPPYSNLEEHNIFELPIPDRIRLRNEKTVFMSAVAEELRSLLQVVLRSETQAYGSGYSSFDAFMFYRLEDLDKSVKPPIQAGVLLIVSREVPAFTFCKYETRWNNVLMPGAPHNALEELPNEYWSNTIVQVKEFMASKGFHFLSKEFLEQDLGFESLLRSDIQYDNDFTAPTERVYDAFFHWSS